MAFGIAGFAADATSTLASLLTRQKALPMFRILEGSPRSQLRYAKKAGEQQLSGFRI